MYIPSIFDINRIKEMNSRTLIKKNKEIVHNISSDILDSAEVDEILKKHVENSSA